MYSSPRIPDVFSHVGSKIGLWIQSDKHACILFFLDICSISIVIVALLGELFKNVRGIVNVYTFMYVILRRGIEILRLIR